MTSEAVPALPNIDDSAAPTMADYTAMATMVENLQEENRQLLQDLKEEREGKGKNKQRLSDAHPNDLSNKMAINRWTGQSMFGNNKIPSFATGWDKFETGHPIRDRLMGLVQVPAEGNTDASYYEKTVVPTFMAKMSNLKGNCVQRMGKAFKAHHDVPSSSEAFDKLQQYMLASSNLSEPEKVTAMNQLFDLIYYYVPEIYGKTKFQQWMKANQDKSLLDKITPSDMAYALLVYNAYQPTWLAVPADVDEDEEEKEEDESHASSSPNSTTNVKKRKKMVRAVSPYCHNKKLKLYENAWTDEGMEFYKDMLAGMKGLKNNDQVWGIWKESWDEYISHKHETGVGCWVPMFGVLNADTADDSEASGAEEVRGVFFEFDDSDI